MNKGGPDDGNNPGNNGGPGDNKPFKPAKEPNKIP